MLPASAAAIPDPIFAVIVHHRALSAAYLAAMGVSAALEPGPEFEAAEAFTSQKVDALIDHAEMPIRSVGSEALVKRDSRKLVQTNLRENPCA